MNTAVATADRVLKILHRSAESEGSCVHVKVITSPGQGTPPVMLDVRVLVLRSIINGCKPCHIIVCKLIYF